MSRWFMILMSVIFAIEATAFVTIIFNELVNYKKSSQDADKLKKTNKNEG